MTLDFSRIAAVLRQMAAIASVVIGAIPQMNLPSSVRVPLVAAGGLVLAIEHYVANPTTGTGATPPTSTPSKKETTP